LDSLPSRSELMRGEPSARPNLFVVGAPKAGTTALWQHLRAHPEIHMSAVKEPHFFSPARSLGQSIVDPGVYAQLFADGAACRYRGEASASYLSDPGACERIHATYGSVRIVVSLRDPVERAYSGYWTWVGIGVERRTFEEMVRAELEQELPSFLAVPPPQIARGFYASQLERYLETFAESVLVLFFDDLVVDTRATMHRVYEWLELDPAPAATLDQDPIFPYVVPRNGAARLALRVPGAREAGDRILRGRLRERVERVLFNREKPPLDPELRRLLREVYAPHDERLRNLLGRPLPWDGRE
jgi:hypothetical protein